MGAKFLGTIGGALVGLMGAHDAPAQPCNMGHGEHHAWGGQAAIGAIAGICEGFHGGDGLKDPAIIAFVFINGHGNTPVKQNADPARSVAGPAGGSKVRCDGHVDAAVEILRWSVGIGHHIPLEDIIWQPERGAGVRYVHHA